MKDSIEQSLLAQFSVPFDSACDLRLQHHYERTIARFLDAMKSLVRISGLSDEDKQGALWGLAYIETHIENQTLALETEQKAGRN